MSLATEFDQVGSRKKTRRSRHGKGKGANNHHQQAKVHLAAAQEAATPQAAVPHLFKALSSLNKATKQSPIMAPASSM